VIALGMVGGVNHLDKVLLILIVTAVVLCHYVIGQPLSLIRIVILAPEGVRRDGKCEILKVSLHIFQHLKGVIPGIV
jgi:hypothetical protein